MEVRATEQFKRIAQFTSLCALQASRRGMQIRYISLEAIKRQVLHHNIAVLGTIRQRTNCEAVTSALDAVLTQCLLPKLQQKSAASSVCV